MEGLIINIGWEYFLGIVGTLVIIVWYAGGKFAVIETRLDVLDRHISKFLLDAFAPAHSPRQLNDRGLKVLTDSGIQPVIDSLRSELLDKLKSLDLKNPYDAEKAILDLTQNIPELHPELLDSLKTGSFNTGTDINSLLFVGGIYLRNLVFKDLGFSIESLDNINRK